MKSQSENFYLYFKELKRIWSDKEFLSKASHSEKHFSRHRTFTLTEWLYFYLQMRKCTVSLSLLRFLPNAAKKFESISSQAFSKARLKIIPEFFLDSMQQLNKLHFSNNKNIALWNGYRAIAIDGSKCTIPNTKVLKENFGISGCTNPEKVKYPSASCFISTAYDVFNDLILDVQIGKFKDSERGFVEPHINAIDDSSYKSILIFDRGYISKELIKTIDDSDMKFLFRVPVGTYKSYHCNITDDGVIFLPIDGGSFKVRVIKFYSDNEDNEIVLFTNLFNDDIDVTSFIELYFKRWKIESNYDNLKQKLQMLNYSGTTVIAVKQDIYKTCLLANMLGLFLIDANKIVVEKKQNKYKYKANINHAIGLIYDNVTTLLFKVNIGVTVTKIIKLSANMLIPIKNGRHSPRRESSRKTNHHQNRKSNI